MRLAIRADSCTGEPPGELTTIATALASSSSKARCNVRRARAGSGPQRMRVARSPPLSGTTATDTGGGCGNVRWEASSAGRAGA